MIVIINHDSMKYGKLTIIKELPKNGYLRKVLVKCDCGNEKEVYFYNLKYGKTKSCRKGACHENFIDEIHNKKYGMNLYSIWKGMKSRCKYSNHKGHEYYYDKGIKVCKEWLMFKNFYRDMISDYEQGLTLDRIDNTKGYYKGNCRWATIREQRNNSMVSKMITYNGITKSITEWAEELKVSYPTIQHRLKRGWSIERALTTPKLMYKNNILL